MVAEQLYLDTNVQLLNIKENIYCLNHSLRQIQIFGSKILYDVFHNISNNIQVNIPADLKNTLITNRFIVFTKNDASEYQRKLIEQENKIKKPSFNLLRILLTDLCNLNCDYCKVMKNIDEHCSNPVSTKKLEETIKFFFENSIATTPKIIQISGGEPTIFFDKIVNIIDFKNKYARVNENCWVVLSTNGTSIDLVKAKYLAENNIKCIVSMDGPEEINDILRRDHANKGSWNKVDSNIKLLKKFGVEIAISMVVGKHTIDHLDYIINFFIDKYNPTGLGINFIKPPTLDKKNYKYLISEEQYAEAIYGIHKKFRNKGLFLELIYRKLQPFVQQKYRFHDCGASAGTTINLNANGKIGPCKSFLVMDKLALKKLDINEYCDLITSKWKCRSPIFNEKCKSCSAIGMCGNGCAYEALIHNNNEMSIDLRSCN